MGHSMNDRLDELKGTIKTGVGRVIGSSRLELAEGPIPSWHESGARRRACSGKSAADSARVSAR
jgi:hypothetical protein